MLSGLRVPLPRPISEEHVSMAPEELRRGGAGRWADEADLVPSGESLALGVNYHRWSLYSWSQAQAKGWRWLRVLSLLADVIYNFPITSLTTVNIDDMGYNEVTSTPCLTSQLADHRKFITNVWAHARNRSHNFLQASTLDEKHFLTRKWLNPTADRLSQ